MTPDLDNESLMLVRGQYSTLRRDAQQRLDALAAEWQHVSTIIRGSLTYKHISDCRPSLGLLHAADRLIEMADEAKHIDDICARLAELRPVAWQGKDA